MTKQMKAHLKAAFALLMGVGSYLGVAFLGAWFPDAINLAALVLVAAVVLLLLYSALYVRFNR